jgi:hypothetical protein
LFCDSQLHPIPKNQKELTADRRPSGQRTAHANGATGESYSRAEPGAWGATPPLRVCSGNGATRGRLSGQGQHCCLRPHPCRLCLLPFLHQTSGFDPAFSVLHQKKTFSDIHISSHSIKSQSTPNSIVVGFPNTHILLHSHFCIHFLPRP